MKKQNWINLLLQNGGNMDELKAIQVDSKTELFGLCKYKKLLRERGGGNVRLAEIETVYNHGDINKLHKLLNEMFLEYYTKSEIDNLLKLVEKTGTSIKEIYNRHIEDPEATILSHLSL